MLHEVDDFEKLFHHFKMVHGEEVEATNEFW